MQRTTFNVLFYIKRTKLLKDGTAPVYLRITVNGKSSETSLKRSIAPNSWDIKQNKARGKTKEIAEFNSYLESVKAQVFNHQRNAQEANKVVTADFLKKAFLGIAEKQWQLEELFEKHNQRIESLVGVEYSPLTLQRFKASLKHVAFFNENYKKNKSLLVAEVDHDYIEGFEHYLKTVAKCQHNSAMKHVKALKKICLLAFNKGYIKRNPFSEYKITTKPTSIGYLTDQELQQLKETPLDIERVNKVRDLFVFQCYTGLAYKDLQKLTKADIQIGIDGNKWIKSKRAKTDVAFSIPLFPIAEAIIEKYSAHPDCAYTQKLLPVPTNQKMNAYLKEVGDLCGISKKLHTHLARHTYATTITLSNGVPMETVSRLLGHSKMKHTQIYSKVLDKKISEDMALLKNKLAM